MNPGNTAFAGTPVASGNVLSNDTDPDALDTKTVSAVNGQSASVGVAIIGLYGSVQINADGSYTYTLDNSKAATQALTQGQLASEAFSYTVKDTAGATSSSTLTVSVTGTNDAPVATADTASTPLNVALASINVKGNDTDVDSTPASLVVSNPVLSNPAQGSVSVNADGTLNFTPASGVSGPVVISYTLTDDKGASTTGTLTVTIGPNTAAPAAPVAVLNPFAPDDTGTIGDSTTSNPSPAISGSGSPGEIITLYAADGVSVLGTAVVNASGTWSIDPLVNYLTEGLNSLSVKATDSAGNQGPATLVAVTLDTTAPTAPTVVITEDTNNDGFISAAELSGLIDVSIGLPADAKAGDSLTVTDGTSTNTIVLTATQISAGSVTSSFASPGEGNTISVTAKITDAAGNPGTTSLADSAKVDTAAPAAPVAVLNPFAPDDTGTIGDSTTSNPSPAISGSGSPGEIITLYAADGVSVLGTAVVNASGTWSIDPLVNYLTEGLNSLSVKATDSAGNQGPATLVAVTLDTTAPTAPTVVITEDTNNDGFISAAELSGLIDVSIGLPADAKAGDSLTVTDGTSTNTIVLTATQISAGSVTSSFASPGEGNTISVTAKITDAAGNPGTTSLADSAKVDTTPTSANPDAVVASEQTPLVIDVATLLNNDHGALGQPLFIASVQGAVNGSVVITDGKVVFTPNVGFIGAANFTYTVKDGNGGSSTASVSVTVLADAPSFAAEAVVYKPSVSMPRPVFSNDPALHVLYSINDIRIDTGLRSGLGIFQTDSVTMAELLSEQAFALDNLTAPRGLDGVDDSHLRGNGIGSQNALFVQHAVRHEALVSEVGLFVQNAVRASQLESLARNIKVDTFNSAVPGVGTLLDAFALGSPVVSPVTALAEALERERQNKPTSRLEKEDSLQASSRVKVEQPYSTPVAADDVSTFQVKRRAADGFATQLRRNATAFRTSALRPETPLSATTRVTR